MTITYVNWTTASILLAQLYEYHQVQLSVFYNPGLEFLVYCARMIGVVLTVIGSQVASSLVVSEKSGDYRVDDVPPLIQR